MKRTTFLSAAASIAALMLTGCAASSAPDGRDAIVQALKDNEAQWNRDYVTKDAAKLLAHYADDAILMAPGMAAGSGREAIRKMLTEMVSDPALSLQFQASRIEVAKSGDIAYTQGAYTMTMTDPNSKQVIHDHGNYVTTYRKEADGSWRAVADIATSDVPPAPPAANAAAKK